MVTADCLVRIRKKPFDSKNARNTGIRVLDIKHAKKEMDGGHQTPNDPRCEL